MSDNLFGIHTYTLLFELEKGPLKEGRNRRILQYVWGFNYLVVSKYLVIIPLKAAATKAMMNTLYVLVQLHTCSVVVMTELMLDFKRASL